MRNASKKRCTAVSCCVPYLTPHDDVEGLESTVPTAVGCYHTDLVRSVIEGRLMLLLLLVLLVVLVVVLLLRLLVLRVHPHRLRHRQQHWQKDNPHKTTRKCKAVCQ